MQFKVPQFIDVEDKLFGPFTFAQFVYMVGGGGLIFLIFKILGLWLGLIFATPVAVLSLLLVFYQINNKPFIYYLQAGLNYAVSNKLYIWKQRLTKPSDNKEEDALPTPTTVVPTVTSSKLKDLSWSLDVQDKNKA